MKLFWGFLVLAQAASIENVRSTKCFKYSCRLGRAHCCKEPKQDDILDADFGVDAPSDEQVLDDHLEISEMPSFPESVNDSEIEVEGSDITVHLPDADLKIEIPKESRGFPMLSGGYFKNLADEIINFDWGKIGKIAEKIKSIKIPKLGRQATAAVARWGKDIFQRFSDEALEGAVKTKLRQSLMKKLLDQLNIIFGAGWDEIHDLAGIGGEQIEKMLLQLQKDMHDTVEMVLEYINFDDDFSVDTLRGDLVELLFETLEQVSDPETVKPLRDIMKDAKNEFRKIMESAVDRTALALFQEIEAILDRLEYDDGFSVETPKDQLMIDLLENFASVLDPDTDLNHKELIKLIRKSLKKFAKAFGKLQLIEKIDLIVEKLSQSDKPLDKALEFFLENLNEVLIGNTDFENIVTDLKLQLLDLAIDTVERLEEKIQNILENLNTIEN